MMLRTNLQDRKSNTNRNEPGRFFGDGVSFKAKLIGILEVGEARGDRMCQEALQDLKMAIRAAGEHKQRITIHVTIDGLRLRDEKTGDSLYHHPVHKISFIAQDMTDSRAFGYIFGSPDSGHRFFGIKTDKAASQVVLAMRDLFQVVFELKKKEIELARQHIQSKITAHEHHAVAMAVKSSDGYGKTLPSDGASSSLTSSSLGGGASGTNSLKTTTKNEKSPESVADLVDLEQELSSIQRGITQMERITPSEVPSKSVIDDDPFGDSFTNIPPAYNLLPPPESSKRHQKQTHRSTENLPATETSSAVPSSSPPAPPTSSTPAPQNVTLPPPPSSSTPGPVSSAISSSNSNQNDDWLNSPPNTSRFDPDPVKYSDEFLNEDGFKPYSTTPQPSSYTDAFTDLDPLGTGKIKPYIDKKYFFQELKNPPKKVLKDLSGKDSSFNANFSSEDQRQSPQTLPNSTNAAAAEMFKPTFDDGAPGVNEQANAEFSDPFDNKSVDPFMEDDDFSKLHIDPFEMKFSRNASPRQIERKSGDESSVRPAAKSDESKSDESPVAYNGPLQVNLPPESWANYISQKRLERQNSDSISSGPGVISVARNRPNVFKQNTVDVISSISSNSKKMKPNLFGQKFSKRDSNSINMRRLQESDSLSENETAPEPPPRPDSGSHIEPPPLPPKKQFADIVIRPSPRSGPTATSTSGGSTKERYDYVASKFESKNQSVNDAPPLPLPSRKVNRSDGSSPGRPFKKLTDEDDYLQPIPAKSEIPTLLPPPQRKDASKTRAARKSETDPRNLDEPTPPAQSKSPTVRDKESFLPNITLSQLLTLGIDELATKLNVPVSKLSTMTLVELTSYLSEFIENSKTSSSSATSWNQEAENNDSPVFKVNFDDNNDATFVAKFDDNFGEDNTFVANFDNLNLQPAQSTAHSAAVPNAPSIDKYAVFREIIEQEIGPAQEPQKTEPEKTGPDLSSLDFDREVASEMNRLSPNITGDQFSKSPSQSQSFLPANSPVPPVPMTKIDTKITQVISQAKDRYAALRDIILVEDLFEKPTPPPHHSSSAPIARMESSSFEDQNTEDEHRFEANFDDMPQIESHSPEINISDADINDEYPHPAEPLAPSSLEGLEPPESHNLSFRSTPKEDLEINAFMHKAVSNLSLHSAGQLSPAPGGLTVKSPQLQNTSTSPSRPPIAAAGMDGSLPPQTTSIENLSKATLNDMSTSPIPLSKSTMIRKGSTGKSSSSPMVKSPMDYADDTTVAGEVNKRADSLQKPSSGSLSDGEETSPEAERNHDLKASKLTPTNANESWAVFDQPEHHPAHKKVEGGRLHKGMDKPGPESPCSSDPKDEWKNEREYARRWPTKGHTSSSSRDVSPWDEDGPEYRKRPPSQHHPPTSGERYHHPRMPPRRINSNDEDYEDDMKDRSERRRRTKGQQISSRSRDNFEDEHWYHEHQSWSPTEEDERPDRSRSFDRNAYERSTYGPPYEKREPKSLPPYDRRDYKNYDKRKYYRERGRPNYDYDHYGEGYDQRMMKGRMDYEDVYERGPRDSRAAREYFYERDRKSFDRDSNESYERRSFGSGDIYGSLDSRGDYRDRDRYLSLDKSRPLRRGMRNAGSARLDDPDQDSEGETVGGRRADTNSLHRSSQNIRGKQHQVVDDEVWGVSMGGKLAWKRPSSASEQERRYNESRRMMTNTTLPGSDGEKDRRFRKKNRTRSKEPDIRPGYATMRYPPRSKEDYLEFEFEPRAPGSGGGMYDNDEEEEIGSGKMMEESVAESPSYYGRRQPPPPYYKPATPRIEGRSLNDTLIAQEAKKMARYEYEEEAMRRMKKSNSRDLYFEGEDKERFGGKFGSGNFENVTPPKSAKHVRMELEFEDFGETPQTTTSGKFNFEGGDGFESDFNSPPAPPAGVGQVSLHTAKTFRFSNDFSEKDPGRHYPAYHKGQPQSFGGFEADFGPKPRPASTSQTASKLRFNENVTVSKFSSDAATGSHMFEDDFAGRSDNELEDQWTPEMPAPVTNNNGSKKILKTSSQQQSQQHDNIHKSDSVNIFAKKVDDPFEDDDFFTSGAAAEKDPFDGTGNGSETGGGQSGWDKNFANFDDNI
ncbi:protein disabled isoform X2 [Ochlerotatus camptorhynchus]|uniref:protein disabled isoform X2 n=1 Tax=Ochlerotatus camptorhynchus TaxID=644619 RepID=UPI0031D33050